MRKMGLLAGMVNYVNVLTGFFVVIVAVGLLLGGFQNLETNILLAAFAFGAGGFILLLFVLKWLFGKEVSSEEGLTLSNIFLVFAVIITAFFLVLIELLSQVQTLSPILSEGISAFFVLTVIGLIIIGLLIPNWTLAEIRDAILGLVFGKGKKKKVLKRRR